MMAELSPKIEAYADGSASQANFDLCFFELLYSLDRKYPEPILAFGA